MIRKIAMLAALCALTALSLVSSASAATFIRAHGTSAPNPTYSGAISATQEATSSLVGSGGQTASCSHGTFAGTVGASGGATVTGTVTELNFGSTSSNICTSNFGLQSCELVSASGVSATATTTGHGTLNIGTLSEKCAAFAGFVQCTFHTSNVSGTLRDVSGGTTLSFTNINTTSGSGGACPTSATFSGAWFPLTGTNNTKLYINTH